MGMGYGAHVRPWIIVGDPRKYNSCIFFLYDSGIFQWNSTLRRIERVGRTGVPAVNRRSLQRSRRTVCTLFQKIPGNYLEEDQHGIARCCVSVYTISMQDGVQFWCFPCKQANDDITAFVYKA